MTNDKEEQTLEGVLSGPYKPQKPRPTSWADFRVNALQVKRPVAPSSLTNNRASCLEHRNRLKSAVTRMSPVHGNVARIEYLGCDCVEYRPIRPKNYTSGGDFRIRR